MATAGVLPWLAQGTVVRVRPCLTTANTVKSRQIQTGNEQSSSLVPITFRASISLWAGGYVGN